MKKFSKILSVALLVALVLSLGVTNAFAAEITINSTADATVAVTDTTAYTWYQIFEADIDTAPTQDGVNQTGGKVAYYVTTQARATAINGTGLFNVTRVGDTDKWYVELKDSGTQASTIAAKFDAMDLTLFPTGTFAQTEVGGTAKSGTVDPGYYYIKSTAGTNVVIQTLSNVTIDEKNTYPPVEKVIADEDKNAQIGDEINYTLTVVVPGTANDTIILTDTMDEGLTFKSIESVKSNAEGTPDVTYTAAPTASTPEATAEAVTANGNKFTITFSADTVKANQGKTITILYTAVLNNKAIVNTPEINEVFLKYGNNYESKPKRVESKTYEFSFDKVDGSDTTVKLTGAEFKLTTDASATAETTTGWIELIEVTPGVEYRVKMSEDTATPVTTMTTNGNTVTIKGLDADVTYYLVETKVPTGYNGLAAPIQVKATENASNNMEFVHQNVENNKGSVLPSTGGIGTTIFYVVGGVLVLAAIILLVTKKRMSE